MNWPHVVNDGGMPVHAPFAVVGLHDVCSRRAAGMGEGLASKYCAIHGYLNNAAERASVDMAFGCMIGAPASLITPAGKVVSLAASLQVIPAEPAAAQRVLRSTAATEMAVRMAMVRKSLDVIAWRR